MRTAISVYSLYSYCITSDHNRHTTIVQYVLLTSDGLSSSSVAAAGAGAACSLASWRREVGAVRQRGGTATSNSVDMAISALQTPPPPPPDVATSMTSPGLQRTATSCRVNRVKRPKRCCPLANGVEYVYRGCYQVWPKNLPKNLRHHTPFPVPCEITSTTHAVVASILIGR